MKLSVRLLFPSNHNVMALVIITN